MNPRLISSKDATTAGAGGDGTDMEMEHRLTVVETRLDSLATGKDVEALRGDMHKEFTNSTRWTFGIVLGIVGVAVTILIFAINRASPPPTQTTQPQPIIIHLPTPVTAVAPAPTPVAPDTKK